MTPKLPWAKRQRIEFIVARLCQQGHINRADIMDAFEISQPQASKDLHTARAIYPKLMRYNTCHKRYELRQAPPEYR